MGKTRSPIRIATTSFWRDSLLEKFFEHGDNKNIDCYWKMLYNMFCIGSYFIQEGSYFKLRFTDIRQRALKESLRLAQEKIARHKKYRNNTVVNEKGIEEILIKVCKIDG